MSVVLYIATSLDGFIADRDGGVGWLSTVEAHSGEDYGYAGFYDSVDALAMGRVTYEQVRGFGDWPYPGKPAYVFSRTPPRGRHPDVTFVPGRPKAFVETLGRRTVGQRRVEGRAEPRIWLVGGGGLVASFREVGLIDEYVISVIPVLLGEGVPLFSGRQPETALRHAETHTYANGVVQLRYARR